jgi:outer membrane protein assembly factor BamE (lipoprotein component of BamABCDE complex)
MSEPLRIFAILIALLAASCAWLQPGARGSRGPEIANRVELGMTQAQIRALIGPPDRTWDFTRSVAWDYEYMDAWGYFAEMAVTFDARGVVVGMISLRTNDGGDHGSN